MTMISKKVFTSSNYRLFMLPAFTRAFLFKSPLLGELSYNIRRALKNALLHFNICLFVITSIDIVIICQAFFDITCKIIKVLKLPLNQ